MTMISRSSWSSACSHNLTVIALFVNGSSDCAALRLARDLDVSCKTVFVLLNKLREVIGHNNTLSHVNHGTHVDFVEAQNS